MTDTKSTFNIKAFLCCQAVKHWWNYPSCFPQNVPNESWPQQIPHNCIINQIMCVCLFLHFFVQESNACNHLFCNVIWSGPCNSSFPNSSPEPRLWERDECARVSTCLSALLSLNVAASLWLTARPCCCRQLRLTPRDNITLPHFSLHLPPPTPISSSQLFFFLLILLFSPSLLLLLPSPVETPTIRSHLSVCTSAIRASWQPNASRVPKLHTHTQRLCPD